MVAQQEWIALRRGVYAEAGKSSFRVLLAAAEVGVGRGWVASHGSAALVHGLVLLRPARADRLVLSVPPTTRGHSDPAGVHIHRAGLGADHITVVDGVPVTSVARTLVDLARALPLRDAVVAMDAARHAGQVTRDELAAVVADCRRWPWVRRAGQAVALSDAAAESPLESVSRLFFVAHDIPMPRSQVTLLRNGLFVARTDFWWDAQRVAGEADGLAKYTDADILRQEKLRQERIEATGARVVRWTWYDVDQPAPARRTAARLLAALRRAA